MHYLLCRCQPNPQLPPCGEFLHVSKVLRHSGAGIAGNERRAVVDVLQKLFICFNHAFYGRSHFDYQWQLYQDSCFPWAFTPVVPLQRQLGDKSSTTTTLELADRAMCGEVVKTEPVRQRSKRRLFGETSQVKIRGTFILLYPRPCHL